MMKKNIIITVIILFLAFMLYYLMLPPLNLTSPLFWSYLFLLWIISTILLALNKIEKIYLRRFNQINKPLLINIMSIPILIGLIIIINICL